MTLPPIGLHASSIFQYFPSKLDIYDALFAQGHRQLHAAMTDLDREGDPETVFRRGSAMFTAFCTADPVRYQLLFQRTIPEFATGSRRTSVDGVVVDRAHSYAFGEPAWADGPLWRLPVFTVLAPCLAAVFLGIARGALDEIGRLARDGRAAMRTALSEDPLDMADLATADARLRAARAGMLEVLDHAWTLAEEGTPVDRIVQGRAMLATVHVVDMAVEATSTAHRLGGGPAAYDSSILLRALRDVHTARQHALFARGLTARLGPAAAGIDVVVPPFVA